MKSSLANSIFVCCNRNPTTERAVEKGEEDIESFNNKNNEKREYLIFDFILSVSE